ncbi:MAG TPA: PfkB family carbohydrate kinase [Planctomycetota bacterium]|nr:PfkB family carbohydrate kinase [Planctomycetota bacterium]
MSVLVVGTVAFDSIETPFGRARRTLGGSATYFSLAASLFCPVRLVSVVGGDFPPSHLARLRRRGVRLEGLEVADGKTFRWEGRYEGDLSVAETLATELNVYGRFAPRIPKEWKGTPFVFLANGAPAMQLSVLAQMKRPRLVFADTMNFWIDTTRRELHEVLRHVDGLALNGEEAKTLAGERNLIRAGRKLLDLGPRMVLVKKGEHGSFFFSKRLEFALPAYPTGEVRDTTGAGDSFAGGFLGSLARSVRIDGRALRRAVAYGTVVASFTVESLGTRSLERADRRGVERRFKEMVRFVSL